MKHLLYFSLLFLLPFTLLSQQNPIYYQCGNKVKIEDLGLISAKKDLKVKGATLISNPHEPDFLFMVPKSARISVSGVHEATKRDTVLWLTVVRPPAPQFAFTYKGKIVRGNQDIPNELEEERELLHLIIIPDSLFEANCPLDVDYAFLGGTLNVQRGMGEPLKLPLTPRMEPSPEPSFTNDGKKANLWVILETVQRTNAEGLTFEVRLPKEDKIIRFEK